jgi:hypothetical protein
MALATAVLTGAGAWYLRPSPRLAVTKFQFALPPGELLSGVNRHVVAISPDGSEIVFVGTPGRSWKGERMRAIFRPGTSSMRQRAICWR